MSRFDDQLDEPWIEHGDRYFNSYNSKLEANLLPEGTVANSINKRFRDGVGRTRMGMAIQGAASSQWNPAVWTAFLGNGYYNDPVAVKEYIIVGLRTYSGNTILYTYDIAADTWGVLQTPPEVEAQASQMWITQAFDQVIFLPQGVQNHPSSSTPHWTNVLIWGGQTIYPQWATWNGSNQNEVIPPSYWAAPVSNRMVYWGTNFPGPPFADTGWKGDRLTISNVLDYGNCDPVLGVFRINTGEADHIHTVIPYAYDSLVVFMHKSIHLLRNFSIDFNLATQEVLTEYVGCGSIRSPIQVGQEIYFMSEGVGVMRLSEVLEQRLMSRTLPVSDDIQPVIDRINWPSQDRIVSAAQDNYLFFAVPLDGSTVNNAILVYNTTTAKWESVDEFPITSNVTGAPAHFENIIAAHIADVRRLIGVQTQPPMLWLMYEGNQDQIGWDNPQFSNGFPTGNWGNPTYQPITDEMETRDYGLVDQAGPNSYRRFERGSVGFDAPAGTNVKITAKMANGITRDFPAVLGKTRIRFPIKKIDRTMSLDITCNSSSSEDCNVVATSVESREIYRNAKTTPQRVNWWFRGIGDPNLIAGGIPPALPDDLYLDMATGDVWELT